MLLDESLDAQDALTNMVDLVVKTLIAASLLLDHGAPIRIQAQEHGNATLTWRCPPEADAPLASLYIHIWSVKLGEHCRVYLYDDLQQSVLYQDQRYKGRVQCDLELAQQGRIECVFSDLRLDDTGNYSCIACFHQQNSDRGTQSLMVTEADPPLENKTSEPEGRYRYMMFVCFGLITTAVLALLCCFIAKRNNSTTSCVNSKEATRSQS